MPEAPHFSREKLTEPSIRLEKDIYSEIHNNLDNLCIWLGSECGLGGITFTGGFPFGRGKSEKDFPSLVFLKDNYEKQDDVLKALQYVSVKLDCLLRVLKILVGFTSIRKLLGYLLMVKKYEGVLYYELVQKISSENGLSPSTVRWNLNKLRDAKLIVAGDKDRKGSPVKLTEEARLIISVFNLGNR